jgi:hypothetical protein
MKCPKCGYDIFSGVKTIKPTKQYSSSIAENLAERFMVEGLNNAVRFGKKTKHRNKENKK